MKALTRFLLYFVLLFGLLTGPWPRLHPAVHAAFRSETGWVIRTLFHGQALAVEAYSDRQHPRLDIAVTVADPRSDGLFNGTGMLKIPFDSVSQGLMPLAMLLALFLATPAPWSRRWRGLLAGIIVVEFLVLVTIGVAVRYGLAGLEHPEGPSLGLAFAHRLLVENVWSSFVPPILWWIGWLALASPRAGWNGANDDSSHPQNSPAARKPIG